MAHLTREQILARKVGKDVVPLPGGGTVAIRALTRDDVLATQQADDVAGADNMIISLGLTDPKLSVDEVAQWAANDAAGDLVAVSDAIARISGLKEGAGKSGVPGTGE